MHKTVRETCTSALEHLSILLMRPKLGKEVLNIPCCKGTDKPTDLFHLNVCTDSSFIVHYTNEENCLDTYRR